MPSLAASPSARISPATMNVNSDSSPLSRMSAAAGAGARSDTCGCELQRRGLRPDTVHLQRAAQRTRCVVNKRVAGRGRVAEHDGVRGCHGAAVAGDDQLRAHEAEGVTGVARKWRALLAGSPRHQRRRALFGGSQCATEYLRRAQARAKRSEPATGAVRGAHSVPSGPRPARWCGWCALVPTQRAPTHFMVLSLPLNSVTSSYSVPTPAAPLDS
jgi:hypothetical protein